MIQSILFFNGYERLKRDEIFRGRDVANHLWDIWGDDDNDRGDIVLCRRFVQSNDVMIGVIVSHIWGSLDLTRHKSRIEIDGWHVDG